jgi:hypothetical protein
VLPLPWADKESDSALASVEDTRRHVSGAGFEIRQWRDVTALAEYVSGLEGTKTPSSPLGVQLVVPDMHERARMLARNLAESRVRFVQCLADAV